MKLVNILSEDQEKKLIVILACGDRNWSNSEVVRKYISEYNPSDLIEGEAKGADSIARDVAMSIGAKVHRFPANWASYGRAAGPIRNKEMLNKLLSFDPEKYDRIVLAFHDNIEISKGTKNMISQASKSPNVKVQVISSK